MRYLAHWARVTLALTTLALAPALTIYAQYEVPYAWPASVALTGTLTVTRDAHSISAGLTTAYCTLTDTHTLTCQRDPVRGE